MPPQMNNGTDLTAVWFQTLSAQMADGFRDVRSQLDTKADKEDLRQLMTTVGSLQSRVRDDEVKRTVVAFRWSRTSDRVKWAIATVAVLLSGAIGTWLH